MIGVINEDDRSFGCRCLAMGPFASAASIWRSGGFLGRHRGHRWLIASRMASFESEGGWSLKIARPGWCSWSSTRRFAGVE